jgi:hypothetical protein
MNDSRHGSQTTCSIPLHIVWLPQYRHKVWRGEVAERVRAIGREAGALTSSAAVRRLRELAMTEQRSLMLLVALRSFYVALGSFASAALVSMGADGPVRVLEVGGVVAGLLAVSALVHGSVMLVRETRLVVQVLQERAASVHARAGP